MALRRSASARHKQTFRNVRAALTSRFSVDLFQRQVRVILFARFAYPGPVMSCLPASRRLQRRLSFVLMAALCLWMLALASHFHLGDSRDDAHPGTHALCAFCVSVPSSGTAPVAVAFVAAPQPHSFLPSAEIAPVPVAPAISRYYSRGPPLV
jgi:hypothetical protein